MLGRLLTTTPLAKVCPAAPMFLTFERRKWTKPAKMKKGAEPEANSRRDIRRDFLFHSRVANQRAQAVVLYWYQTPRRVVAGEWAANYGFCRRRARPPHRHGAGARCGPGSSAGRRRRRCRRQICPQRLSIPTEVSAGPRCERDRQGAVITMGVAHERTRFFKPMTNQPVKEQELPL